MAEHHAWIGQHLSTESIKRIQALPKFVEKEVEGSRFLLTHYHMSNDKLDVIDKEPSGTKLDTKYQGTAHDLVCFGHHHILHYYRTDQRIYMNPGALGCNDLAIARYGIVDLQEGKLNVKFIGVPYDNREYLKSYERLNIPDRAFILKAFHGNQLEREYGGSKRS